MKPTASAAGRRELPRPKPRPEPESERRSSTPHPPFGAAVPRRLLAALVVLSGLFPAGTAFGHAAVIASNPVDGAVIEAAPGLATLTFDEAVRPLVARLSAPDGKTGLLGEARADGNTLTYSIPILAQQGSYVLSWRATASDGHPLAGALVFSLGHASQPTGIDASASPLARRIGFWLARVAVVSALLFGVGGATFRAFAGDGGRPDPTPLLVASIGLLALPLLVGFQGLDLLGLPPSSLLDPAPWREALTGAAGAAPLVAGAALVLTLVAERTRGRVVAAAALVLAGLSAAIAGHAATAAPQLLTRPSVALHLVAAALWIGALIPLSHSLAQGKTRPLLRFGAMIPWALGILLLSGTAIAVI